MRTGNENILVSFGAGSFSRGHTIPKLYYRADTHMTNFIVRDKIRGRVLLTMFGSMIANLLLDSKLGEAERLAKPKDTMEKKDDNESDSIEGIGVMSISNPTFREVLGLTKRSRNLVIFDLNPIAFVIDRLSAPETYTDIRKNRIRSDSGTLLF